MKLNKLRHLVFPILLMFFCVTAWAEGTSSKSSLFNSCVETGQWPIANRVERVCKCMEERLAKDEKLYDLVKESWVVQFPRNFGEAMKIDGLTGTIESGSPRDRASGIFLTCYKQFHESEIKQIEKEAKVRQR